MALINYITNYLRYLSNNPNKYWFRAKWYGWGWTPATWEGWCVTIGFILFVLLISLIGEDILGTDISLSITIFALIIFLVIAYKTGEKPRWQWGPPKK